MTQEQYTPGEYRMEGWVSDENEKIQNKLGLKLSLIIYVYI